MIEILYPKVTSCGAHNEADEEFLPSGHKYESIKVVIYKKTAYLEFIITIT
jgi:hypothetical protein